MLMVMGAAACRVLEGWGKGEDSRGGWKEIAELGGGEGEGRERVT